MLDIEMVRAPLFALVRATGSLRTAAEVDTFTTALEFVPKDDDLVVDLSGLRSMNAACASELSALLLERADWSETVVVSPDPDVTVQLVLGEVDHVVPVLTTMVHATDLIRARRGMRTTEVGV
jgi:anti-anti-sigma regulatory factor